MKLTLLTCACPRPEAWKLCESYIARQTVKPFQWLVLDDDDPKTECTMGQEYHHWPEMKGRGSMTKKITRAITDKLVKGDAIVFVENDDFYAPTYLEKVDQWLSQAQLVGEGDALYYNVQHRFMFAHKNNRHASLCSTAMRVSLMDHLRRACATDDPFVDYRLWNLVAPNQKRIFMPDDNLKTRLTVGIKGMPGTAGYGSGHTIKHQPGTTPDPKMERLTALIGKDAEAYAPFMSVGQPLGDAATKPPQTPPVAITGLSETDRVHGPVWEKWLAQIKGKPNITGLELGTFKGESAECMLTRIFTDPTSRYYCVDWFEGSDEHKVGRIDVSTIEAQARKRLERFKNVTIIKSTSHTALYGFKTKLDVVYVDAAHDSMNVLRDAVLAFDLMEVGGIMIFDDYGWDVMPLPLDRPKTAIDSFLTCYGRQIEVLGKGYQVAIRKVK